MNQQASERIEERENDYPYATFPELNLGLYRCLNQFRVTESYNRLWKQWHAEQIEPFRITLRFLLELVRQSPNPTAPAVKRWIVLARQNKVNGPALVRRLQLLNPTAGKGGNAPKANAVHEGNIKGFWLLEYLKFVGVFTLAIPARLKESKDRQIYILRASSGELSAFKKIGHNMRMAVQCHTATASDVLVLLQLAYMLVEQVKEALAAPLTTPVGIHHATSTVDLPLIGSRLEVAYYKNMGSAHAIMHMATLHPPFWLCPLKTVGEADALLTILSSTRNHRCYNRVIEGTPASPCSRAY